MPPFVPPADYPAPARPPVEDAAWYGAAALWTMLHDAGEVWNGLPRGSDGRLTQKTFWWSADFDVNHELSRQSRSALNNSTDRVGS